MTPASLGFKPVAWANGNTNITLSGVALGTSLEGTLDGAPVALSSKWTNATTVNLSFPAGNASSAAIKTLRLDIGDAELDVNVTVLPDTGGVKFTEDPAWLEMFEAGGGAGWHATGWNFTTLQDILDTHSLGGKQRFTRASGVVAAALGMGTHVLRSPHIPLPNPNWYEVRLAVHYKLDKGVGAVDISYDGGSPKRALRLNDTGESEMLRIPLAPPAGARSVQVTFSLTNGDNDAYWLLDDVELVPALAARTDLGEPVETIDIISDVQGTIANQWMANSLLPGLRKLRRASTLVFNGDLVEHCSDSTYYSLMRAFNRTGAWDYYNNSVIFTAGNHEMFSDDGDSDAHIDKFLSWTNMKANFGAAAGSRGLWGEHVTAAGTPLLWLGSEHYSTTSRSPPFVELSDEQFLFLADRLSYWRAQKKPVLLFSHHPLPYSVSGSWDGFDRNSFGEDEARFRYLLAANPHALLVTSHTHYDIAAKDQNVNHRPVVGHPATVKTFNTGATINYYTYGADDAWETVEVGDKAPTALQAEVYNDRIRIKAYRFWDLSTTATLVQTRDVGSPLGRPPTTRDVTKSYGRGNRLRVVWSLVVAGALASLSW